MRKLNCRAGDLAIIVDAFTSDNIGMIVKVLGKHRNQSVCPADDVIWLVQAPHPMRYEKLGKIIHKKKGPVPDTWLNLGGTTPNFRSKNLLFFACINTKITK